MIGPKNKNKYNSNLERLVFLKLKKMDGNYRGAEHTFIHETLKNLHQPVAPYRFVLPSSTIQAIQEQADPFQNDAYRISTFLSCYSRKTRDDLSLRVQPRDELDRSFQTSGKVIQLQDFVPAQGPEHKETWNQVVVRVIEGLFSHYVSHMEKNRLSYSVEELCKISREMALSMARMEWTPPGRGLYAMGTEHTYRNGSAALNNCYAVSTENDLVRSASWAMDMLMCGGGVGFDTMWKGKVISPNKEDSFVYVIPDTRQGWVSALELLLRAYVPLDGKITNKFPVFDYSLIRPYGEPISGFGGTASGPNPLRMLLCQVEIYLDTYIAFICAKNSCFYRRIFNEETQEYEMVPHITRENQVKIYTEMCQRLHEANAYSDKPYDYEQLFADTVQAAENYDMPYDSTRLIADIFNSIGFCVVAGNVRRSAQIILGEVGDQTFLNLKNWMMHPLRRQIMQLSNNTIRFWNNQDFEKYLGAIADRIRDNGEPGIANMINIQKYGRFSDTEYGPDDATLLNPCAEISLTSYEPCCLSTVVPMNCVDEKGINAERLSLACRFATFYATVVTTIPHHWSVTNAAIAPRRRIGVSPTGIADVYEKYGVTRLISSFKSMYRTIRSSNKEFASSFGIPRAVRVTTVKPEGTVSIVVGTSAGVHFPLMSQGIRRIAYDNTSPVLKALLEAGYNSEEDSKCSTRTYIKFPYKSVGRYASQVGIFEKTLLAALAQRHYSDNSVSYTGDFSSETEANLVEKVIAANIPQMKAISMFGLGAISEQYKHLPFQQTSEEVYLDNKAGIREVNWQKVLILEEDASKEATSFCTGDTCTITRK